MNELLSLPITQTLGLTLLHFLWQGSVVGIVLFVMLCILPKPQTRYMISCLALLALAVLPVVTFANLYKAPVRVQSPLEQTDIAVSPDTTKDELRLEPTPRPPEQRAQTLVEKSKLTLYLPWIVIAWFMGVIVFLASCFLALSHCNATNLKV
jgi:bla regulator protein blaR1